ncbi:peptide ABC transporter ATP-binding protein [Anaerobacillus alkalidiazotrophicus]|uniref:Peptide ABC transporter ATP-binding protein n=1 Tax=Anaerobacillus alkalidiazotrophicus TaxID=472963 RepID=A0A1S2MCA6_9BACI|nr:ABC transporter ATP-binding protein [Anaerobacillus alkalidiazotrophicus]OIJ22204.1 peptide ABC transporter ATP-binding protein [Anaerobacillus alkalidiazotrophicus]
MIEPLISIQNLHIENRSGEKLIVNNVNLEVFKGEIVALIGESGSGKSVTSKAIMGLIPSSMNVQGQIFYNQEDIVTMFSKKKRQLLGKEIGMIFQDYRGSFTPFIKVGKQMVETICTHQVIRKKEAKNISIQVLEEMGLEAERVYKSYPFQLSGGQVQRVAIAMALALKPSLLICDEITTALDVMSGEKVLNYIEKLRKETGCAVLMITHDLTKAYKRADRIYVMHKGQIVEEGDPEQIRCYHKHPYTKKLCSCLLSLPSENLLDKNERVI